MHCLFGLSRKPTRFLFLAGLGLTACALGLAFQRGNEPAVAESPGPLSVRVFLPLLATDRSLVTNTPLPASTPTAVVSATPTLTPSPTTPAQPTTTSSYLADGDESDVLFNDFESGTVSATTSEVRVQLVSRHTQGFSFYTNWADDDSYVAVRFFFTQPTFTNDDLYVTVHDSKISVYRTSGGSFDLVATTQWNGKGRVLEFSLPRSLFGTTETLYWSATGAEARSSPRCSSGSCSWYDYDRMPEVLASYPSLELP
jgi:hypothetical protein